MRIIGYDKLIKDLRAFGVEGEKRIAETTEATARDIELNAKQLAPGDLGTLRQEIRSVGLISNKGQTWKILANANGRAPYSAYQEFGTGGLVDLSYLIEAGYPASEALKFKGKGIKKVDLRPQPFLYPAFVDSREQYIKDLEGALNELTKNK